MANPRFAWGIDVGNRALKAIKLVRDGSGAMRVDDVDVIEHEHILSDAGDNKETLVTTALHAFAAKHPEKGGAVAIGVSGQSSFARFIKLPPVEEKKIPEIVRFEAIQQIPFPLDDVEWAYQLFRTEESPDVEVGIFAMRKELVQQHIRNFTDSGLNVQVVQMNPLAVYNAMYYDQRLKGTTMIVDVGAENTDLIISEGENVWLRSIPVGGNNFTEALVKQFKLKFPKAEELKRNAATSKYTRQILQAMRPVFDNLVSEIQRSIGFYASVHRDARISRVIALGGTFRLPGLMKFLQMQLQLDVQRFDALGASPPSDARVATLLNDNVLSVVGSYGLALQAMGEGKIISSLLPLQIRRERMWKDKTKWFAAAAALVCLGTGIAGGRWYLDRMQYDSAKQTRDQINTELQTAQGLANDWGDVEKAGEPERKQIYSLQALTRQRDLQAKLLVTIDKALPEPPASKPKQPRDQRPVVKIIEMAENYYEDLTPAIAKDTTGDFKMPATEFILNEAGSNVAGGGYGQRGAKTLAVAGAAVPNPAAPAADAVATGTKQRGFLVTLTCDTPMKNWSDLGEQIRTALVDQTKPDPNSKEHQEFRIERVQIVSRRPLDQADFTPAARQRPTAGNAVSRRPGAQSVGRPNYGPSGAFRTGPVGEMEEGLVRPSYRNRYPAGAAAGRNPTGRNPSAVGPGGARRTGEEVQPEDQQEFAPPALNFDQPDPNIGVNANQPIPYVDPLTGEDATKDSRVKFLIAVAVDVPPPAPPAPAEGQETPAQTAAAQ
jgi:type IV pilus assembly protein PilM